MKKQYLNILLIFLFASCCLICQVQADDNSDLKDRLLREAIPAWKDLKKKSDNLTYEISENRDDIKITTNRDHAISKYRLSIKGNNMLECAFSDNGDGTVMENYRCRNKKYYFEIDRAKQTKSWSMNNFIFSGTSDYEKEVFSSYYIASVAWSILGIPMMDIVNEPSFEIKSFSTEKNEENDELITLTFTLKDNKLQERFFNELQLGVVKFNVTKNWIILSYELSSYANDDKRNYHYQGKCECEYDFSRGTPYIKTRKYTLFREKADIKNVTWIANILSIEPCTLKNNDFTLSAFGLAEPNDETSHHKIIRYVLCIIGLIIILASLIRMHIKRKLKN
ncbi:MAG: hypothetical protein LBP59_08750 [Planctomycetaceae bacterium]|jgi:hypothetical protein|nr:hypothetical protein [Planctomycetaceae bacterium]